MDIQAKELQKDEIIQEISLERTYTDKKVSVNSRPFRSKVKVKHSIGREFQSLPV